MTSEDPSAKEGWPGQAAESIEAVITAITDKTVRPLTAVAKAFVFGVVAGIMAQVVVVLLAVGLVRVLDVYAFPGRVWATYALVGGIFVLLGGFLWSKRRAARG